MTNNTEPQQPSAPLVSVGIPVYNGERFIAQAIRSVLEQTFSDFELLVSDNASTDSTVEVVRGFGDARIRLLLNETNQGPGRNYNRLLAEARGSYVKVLSADDYLMPRALERMASVLEAPENAGVVLVTSPREVVHARGKRLARRGPRGLTGRVAGDEAIRRMVRTGTNLVGETSAALFRMDAVRRAGTFLGDAPYCVDMDFWFRLLESGDLYVLPETLSAYRVAGGAWSMDVLDRQAADVIELLERTRARGVAGVTDADVRRGARAARRSAWMRRAFYAWALRRGGSR